MHLSSFEIIQFNPMLFLAAEFSFLCFLLIIIFLEFHIRKTHFYKTLSSVSVVPSLLPWFPVFQFWCPLHSLLSLFQGLQSGKCIQPWYGYTCYCLISWLVLDTRWCWSKAHLIKLNGILLLISYQRRVFKCDAYNSSDCYYMNHTIWQFYVRFFIC